jgi:hypothetical protein
MYINIKGFLFVLSLTVCLSGFGLSGCTALDTHPKYAKVLDTVAFAVGSADDMTRANTTAEYVSDADPFTSYDLTPGIRGIFRLYGDKASSLYAGGSNTSFIVDSSGHEPWITIMAADLPMGLPVGPGKVHITTTATYPTIGSHINNLAINLEILPGTGSSSDLAYEFGVGATMQGNLTLLEAQSHAQVIPDFPQGTAWPNYGAIEMDLNVPTTVGTPLRLVADDMQVLSRSGLNMLSTQRDVNQDMTVMFISPKGRLRYYEPRFSIVLIDREFEVDDFTATPTITAVRYFDINGNPASGPQTTNYSVELR